MSDYERNKQELWVAVYMYYTKLNHYNKIAASLANIAVDEFKYKFRKTEQELKFSKQRYCNYE